MIDGTIRVVAIVATLIVAAGFTLFAVDELSGASRHQQNEIVSPGSGSTAQAPSPRTGLRKAIDDVDTRLLAPFADVVSSRDRWVSQGVPTLIAILVYGVGLGFLARYVRSRA